MGALFGKRSKAKKEAQITSTDRAVLVNINVICVVKFQYNFICLAN